MKKILLLTAVSIFLASCSGVKKTQEAINTGNYLSVIQTSVKNLAANKTKKSNQPYISLLEDAFKKNTDRELNQIEFYKKDGNASNYEHIFNAYNRLKNIQEQIKPLLPLRIIEENRNANFTITNYDDKILSSKKQLAEYLYNNASNLLANAVNKDDYRRAYDDFNYLNELSPNYADTRLKIEEAHNKGIDYIKVKLVNSTDKIIPVRLEDDLLNFNTYGLNDLWTAYHTQPINNVVYDYEMKVDFREINISPEQIREKVLVKESQIKDGYKYVLDEDGQVVLDEDGNKVKTDKFKTVRCNFYQFTQSKSAQVTGVVSFTDLNTKQQVNTYPLASEFIFEHNYANYRGDKRALTSDLISMLSLKSVQFPSNEQMVYDAGESLKANLKNIITRHKF
ncbi:MULTISPECIES: hypothetical protein [unclassified Cellulophaga]|uniref:hypothetical protein n=1 Tax=unclassified Cellulophaga TaxID=2634405 RepID=UPI0026E20C8A|nr:MULTISPECIES: hypothetical protein [unclassified Cellulophaga]MDO6491500.1 hypothetical protein [Cellulophaga sp. 2_MG-2023]MDO6493377.1 hypothetical protein [Cellulophaga sp. 3_MG-2023]